MLTDRTNHEVVSDIIVRTQHFHTADNNRLLFVCLHYCITMCDGIYKQNAKQIQSHWVRVREREWEGWEKEQNIQISPYRVLCSIFSYEFIHIILYFRLFSCSQHTSTEPVLLYKPATSLWFVHTATLTSKQNLQQQQQRRGAYERRNKQYTQTEEFACICVCSMAIFKAIYDRNFMILFSVVHWRLTW